MSQPLPNITALETQSYADTPDLSIILPAVATVAGTLLLDLLLYVYCLYQRNYPPIKAKNLPLLGVSLLSAILFWFGYAHAMGLFGWNGIWQYCYTFRVWLQYPLGIHLFLFTVIYRLLQLYRTLIQRERVTFKWKLIVFSCYSLVFIGFLIFELLHQAWYFVTYSDATTGLALTLNMTMKEQIGCHSKLEWSIWVFSVIFVELVGLMYLTLRLRDIRKAFHEYREARHTLVWFIVTYLVIFVLYFTKWNRTTAGNLMVILLLMISWNIYFWMVLIPPVYGCAFKHEEALQTFHSQLGLQNSWVETFVISRPATYMTQQYTPHHQSTLYGKPL